MELLEDRIELIHYDKNLQGLVDCVVEYVVDLGLNSQSIAVEDITEIVNKKKHQLRACDGLGDLVVCVENNDTVRIAGYGVPDIIVLRLKKYG